MIVAEPEMAKDAKLSLQQGKRIPQLPPKSIADGLRVGIGSKNYQIFKEHLSEDDIILVSELEIIEALELIWQRMKIIIEPSSATVIAAILKDSRFRNRNVCAIISGGNVDIEAFISALKKKADLPI